MNDDKNLTLGDQKEIVVPSTPVERPVEEQAEVAEIALDSQQKVSDVIAGPEKPVEFTEDEKDFLRDPKKIKPDRLLKLLKGTAEGDRFAQTIAKLEKYTRQFLTETHGQAAEFYLPSMVLLRLFREGGLEKYGISEQAFVREFSCNKIDLCPNFVQAYEDKDGKFLVDSWFGDNASVAKKLPEELTAIIKREMDEMAE